MDDNKRLRLSGATYGLVAGVRVLIVVGNTILLVRAIEVGSDIALYITAAVLVISTLFLVHIEDLGKRDFQDRLVEALNDIAECQTGVEVSVNRLEAELLGERQNVQLSGEIELTPVMAAWISRGVYENGRWRRWLFRSGIRKSLIRGKPMLGLSEEVEQELMNWFRSRKG